VCAYERFSLKLHRCTADQRRTPMLSTRFMCSTSMSLSRAAVVTWQWTYEGAPMGLYRASRSAGTQTEWNGWDTGQPDGPLPGGRWSCAIVAGGKRVTAGFVSTGPRGPVIDVTVCAATDVLTYNGFPVCRKDESAGLNSSECITVDATFVNAAGEKARIDFGVPGQPTTLGGQGNATLLDAAIDQVYDTSACKLNPGTFEWRFLLDGYQEAVKQFVVTSNQ
jgi:hypothetical protein